MTAAPVLGYFFGITAQSAAGRLFPFTIVMYIVHNLEDHCELGSCFDRFEDQFDHTLTHSLPGAGFAAYRFLVYSLFIITCISTFVNRGNSKNHRNHLTKRRRCAILKLKEYARSRCDGCSRISYLLENNRPSACRAVISFGHYVHRTLFCRWQQADKLLR